MTEPRVLYEDEELVAVDKPAGMAAAAGGGIDDDASLHAWVSRHAGGRTYIVHRLDRGTSGVIVFAKTADAHRRLSQAFDWREVGKRYLAVVDGHVRRATGEIAEPLRAFGSGRVGVDPKGAEALTRYRRLERLQDADLLEVEPLTGRRHQIRVHCYAIGHPVMGDTRYGAVRPVGGAPRLMLHAAELRLPVSDGEPLTIRADPPPDFDSVLDGLR
ncbi:MAG TPA: RNA pseudouridine synthase [Candidatus Limnocylindria bacterium]|nr:RNA pseudouridine synthase [Candidatus Limnocylindria bacterium]